MGFGTSWLWQTAFASPRTDAPESEQQFFRERLLSLREKAASLVSRITADMPDMTIHDVTHLDALWEMASIVCKGNIDLNPPEAFVFGGAVLLHDAGMTLAAYPGGLESLKGHVTWKDSYARLVARAIDQGLSDENQKEIGDLATAEALRRLHAMQAEKLPVLSWTGKNGETEWLIDDPTVRNFYGPKIGQVAHSHWWDVGKIEDELSVDLGPLGGKTGNKIDVLKIACLLRVADAMHMDRQRAPSFMGKLLNPKGVSEAHWAFQERMAAPYVEKESLVYSAAPAFGLEVAEAWWLAHDAVAAVDKELREVDYLLNKRGSGRLLANHVKGISNPKELSQYIETMGWVPVNSAVRVSDVPRIIETLGGSKLYGDDPTAPLRELIQNASDAVDARRKLQNRPPEWGEIKIKIDQRDDGDWLIIEDTGIGMSENVMTGPLIDFGNSFWRSSFASEEFPGIQAAGISATGRYGIGFFSVFMLGKRVRVTSRRFDKASDSVRTLEFLNGLHSRPILYVPPASASPVDGGTRVEVLLKHAPSKQGGLLSTGSESFTQLGARVASTAPSLSVQILVETEDKYEPVVRANDWQALAESSFIARLAGTNPKNPESGVDKKGRMRVLTDDAGNIFGRAMIETSRFGSNNTGCITVGGLRATKIDIIRGVLIGRENTASRNDASPLASPAVAATWATDQANLISAAALTGEDKARGAQVVLRFGGDIGELPIIQTGGHWMNAHEFSVGLKSLDTIHVYDRGTVEYDEDKDDVHPRDFSSNFEPENSICFVPNDMPGYYWPNTQKLLGNFVKEGAPKGLFDVIENIIRQEFGPGVTEYQLEMTVGEVNGDEITRPVWVYDRSDESHDD